MDDSMLQTSLLLPVENSQSELDICPPSIEAGERAPVPPLRDVECCVCMDAFQRARGYMCTGAMGSRCDMFTCWECMDESFNRAADPDAIQGTFNTDGELLCTNPQCKCPVDLNRLHQAGNVPVATFEAGQALKIQILRNNAVQAALVEQRARIEAEYARIEQMRDLDEQAAARLKLRIEDALNLKCPRCNAVFVDFEACFAVTCNCGAAFCGWCLADCGQNAHPHVRNCVENPTPGNYFGTEDAFNEHHRVKKMRKCRELIREAGLTARATEILKDRLELSLRELNIPVADVFPA